MTNVNRLIAQSANSARKIGNSQRAFQLAEAREFKTILLLTLAHIPFGVLLYSSSYLGVLHALAVFSYGLRSALRKSERLEKTAYVIAYLIGVEVLWRMANIPIFWEFGKYAAALLMAAALVRRGCYKLPMTAAAYFVLLLPSCVLTLFYYDLSDARGQISSNMSGPLCLFAACWFFSHLRINKLQLRRILQAIIIPIISVGCATLFFTVSNPNISFNTESNFETSGGFGPNQVSSMLGLGTFAAAACLILFQNNSKFKIYFGIAAVFTAAQSVMTFSRGGIYNAVGAAVILALLNSRNVFEMVRRFIPIVLLGGLFLILLFPIMNNFTGGKLQERFEDTGTTNRSDIIESDFEMFTENPIFGVGVGVAKNEREEILGYQSASHTEFSRLISEHGALGLLSILALLAATGFSLLRQKSYLSRALIGGVAVWSSLYMMNAGMRLAAPAVLWGMIFVTVKQIAPPRSRKPNGSDIDKFPLQNLKIAADRVKHSSDSEETAKQLLK